MELDAEHDDGDDQGEAGEADGWRRSDRFQFSQRSIDTPDRKFDPTLNFADQNPRKSIFEYAMHFFPSKPTESSQHGFLHELAAKMEANGAAKYNGGSGDADYKYWRVTTDDVLQWIGCWMYMRAFHQPGGREQYFKDGPPHDFGPTFDLKKWLKVGKPDANRGEFWFKQMHACFVLPAYGDANDKFDRTRKWWDCLREAFYAAVTCGWIMCLDESMIKWLGRGMPGFMVVLRKPTPKGLELHTLCCALSGILLWFEVYEGKEAMTKKKYCDEQKRELGTTGPWKSVALTLRMVDRFKDGGRVLIADSWFGSVACILALYAWGIFAVMNVKTGHKNYPKDKLLELLGFDKKKNLCPKERRGEWFTFVRKISTPSGACQVMASGHNSKKPVLIISTAETAAPADDYTKTWTWADAFGELVKYTIRVPTSMAHAMYHRYYHVVDVHNHFRQGLVSMADVWGTKDWAHRHFAEGLGFWSVNVYLALKRWHPDHTALSHGEFTKAFAHALITLGKEQMAPASGHHPVPSGSTLVHEMCRFNNYKNEKHQCGFCNNGGYFYCVTCFPDGKPTHAFCNPSTGRGCYGRHCAGERPEHSLSMGIKKKCVRNSPRRPTRRRDEDDEDEDENEDEDEDEDPPVRRRLCDLYRRRL